MPQHCTAHQTLAVFATPAMANLDLLRNQIQKHGMDLEGIYKYVLYTKACL